MSSNNCGLTCDVRVTKSCTTHDVYHCQLNGDFRRAESQKVSKVTQFYKPYFYSHT